ncbi:MAG: hypothetical protein KAR30_07405 [Gammaproteobacteria bacterium]|nr:hypothetical protein [Gammaproteobacteria bacterium]
MELELEPIEGKKVLTEEEKERIRRRNRPISRDTLLQFSDSEQNDIKHFLVLLIVLAEHFHHDMEQHDLLNEGQRELCEIEMQKLNEDRRALFKDPPPFLESFIQLLDLCPMEAWPEFETLIKGLQEEDLHHHRDTRLNTGIEAALDNPFLMQVEDDKEEQQMALENKCRITPLEIENLILHFSLEDLVNHLIDSRRISTGEFWEGGMYDV